MFSDMNTAEILTTLEAERDNLIRAIEALRGSQSTHKGRRKGSHLSAAARAKISAAMRKT
jgi:hypothetical protein